VHAVFLSGCLSLRTQHGLVWPCKHVILRVSLKDVHIWQELKLKDDEVEKLSRVRDQVVEELDELTSSLFQVCSNYKSSKHYLRILMSH
jgi:hypothetical protein